MPSSKSSVTGISSAARETALTAARSEGISVGEWLTRRIVSGLSERSEPEVRSEISIPAEDVTITRTAALLGGPKMFNCTIANRFDAHDLLHKGLPGDALLYLVKTVNILSPDRLQNAVGISVRTYQRHKETPKKRLSPEQSGRTWKFAEILGRATDVFGSQSDAETWLENPAIALGQRKPIDLLSTPAGTETVELLLTRLEYGVYT